MRLAHGSRDIALSGGLVARMVGLVGVNILKQCAFHGCGSCFCRRESRVDTRGVGQ